jgi:hypothetical protein
MIIIKLLALIESSNNEISAISLARKLDLLVAIHLIKEAWSLVSPSTIINCFRKANFYKENSVVITEPTPAIPTNELDFNFEDFVMIDENIECSELINEKVIIEDITMRKHENSHPSESSDSSDLVKKNYSEKTTNGQAIDSLEVLQLFLRENAAEDYLDFNRLERQVQSIILSKRSNARQQTLIEWLKK